MKTLSHKHECGRCGTIWEHTNRHCGGPTFEAAHRCPQCGQTQTLRYMGLAAPQFLDPLTEEGRDARALAASKPRG